MNAPKLPKALTALLLALLALGGCATGNSQGQSLEDTLVLYERTVRWGDLRNAVQFLDPESRPDARQLQFELKRFDQVDITGYKVLGQAPGPAPETIQQVVEISVSNRHTARERTIRDVQTWRWDEENKRWWLASGLPNLGRR